ncbi:hypothetical protein BJY16_008320 [Actinoplanes octamycinicus]|uniref:Antibiotic biosynthesis monooxygenase n=1 Tax=Actinoplanes octamycinicus TaxID=135948 RepID=A0A7W7H6E2_9ACTN|nr:hypothetical protein [Actinoplanes octamycinicus]MBB4744861.1 hypothetical protein [Actinoplanes octamycinicus]GIE55447.1 hypothetical protein Aoc01nite_08490 [Actinoplanes octamycinicus]
MDKTYVMAVSTITDERAFWAGLKRAHGRLPHDSRWTLAVASTDGAKAVNIISHDSIDAARAFFSEYTGPFATTEFYEADTANAVGLAG